MSTPRQASRGRGVKGSHHQWLWYVAVLLTYVLCESAVCSELSSNGTSVNNGSEIVGNGTTGSARNSRQLWSLVKNVIKSGLEQSGNNGGSNAGGSGGVGGGLGTIASLFGSAIASGINSDGIGQYHQQQQRPYLQQQNLSPNQFASPNEYMHYLLMNSQNNQHASLPHYLQTHQKEQESTVDLIEKYKEQMASGSENQETATSTGSQIINKLALGTLFEDLDKVSNFLSFKTVENMIEKVNKFDNLKCIPRLMCQMVAKRVEDQKLEEEKKKAKAREDSTSTTTKRPVVRKADEEEDDEDDKRSRVDMEEYEGDSEKEEKNESKEITEGTEDEEEDNDDDDDDDDDSDEEGKEYVVIKKGTTGTDEEQDKSDKEKKRGKQSGRRNGRFLNLNGADTALEQFVKFLDLMQLKDWSLYPYLNGAYQGHQVTRSTDCAYRFSSCPFSDDQLVYYFNNYNGGFFQHI